MDKIKDMSIKKAFITLTFISIVIAVLLSSMSFLGFETIRSNILAKYYTGQNSTSLNPNIIFVDPSTFNQTDQIILKLTDYFRFVLPIIFFIVSVIAAAYIFYNTKLRKPLALLKTSAKKISDNDLDFTIDNNSKDEMGDLCDSFETMRKELLSNNINMWRMMEERKRLNAAFAHDMRTPITVLKGYTDLLTNYIPTDKLNQDKLLSTVSLMADNVSRLEKYVDTMNNIQKMEDMEIRPTEVETSKLINNFEGSLRILSEEQGKTYVLNNQINAFSMSLDEEVVLRVVENIAINAFRYAKKHISINCYTDQNLLYYEIIDDGKGFSHEDLKFATEPFYKDKSITDNSHLGLGLNISKIQCQKHGGSITLSNAKEIGAKVTVAFSLKVDKK
ncbi:HAMP domain-containing sensor histidine kinase [Alkaliphilus serpentinus]|uniref:histidine kinase n=1 Tax=Alkaliphilus serpentinus TaxID=1482731 RepID=A0A833HME7_9FIRM|nr:sensor histidine kinase [Alkaliphilus serpentinus]KAB3527448.1 HAMP domain-containing histidine kinase [Alkaliphilus serpentinus]